MVMVQLISIQDVTIFEFKDDQNAFLFSIDKKKIYSYKNDICYIWEWA